MTSRHVRLAGKGFVINLNNKGGVRKAPNVKSARLSGYRSCVAQELSGKSYPNRAAQRAGFRAAAGKCSGRG